MFSSLEQNLTVPALCCPTDSQRANESLIYRALFMRQFTWLPGSVCQCLTHLMAVTATSDTLCPAWPRLPGSPALWPTTRTSFSPVLLFSVSSLTQKFLYKKVHRSIFPQWGCDRRRAGAFGASSSGRLTRQGLAEAAQRVGRLWKHRT